MNVDDFVSVANEIEAEPKQLNAATDDLLAQMEARSPEYLARANGYSKLPEPHKLFVEMCGKKGIMINEGNFHQVVEIVKGQIAE